jgi:urease accessory protein
MLARKILSAAVAVAGMLATAGAEAHTLGAHSVGFVHGFTHPVGGFDHVLAMIAVGIWATQTGGRAVWLVPTSFVAMMVVGGLIGVSGLGLPMIEIGIAGSVLAMGGLIAFSTRLPVAVGMAIVGLFALFHGQAHGTEMPQTASVALYGLGFVISTVGLHLTGVGFAHFAGSRFVRFGGVGIAAAGAALLAVI